MSCSLKATRVYRDKDGRFFWIEAVEGDTGDELVFARTVARDAYEGSLIALWLWRYGSDATAWCWALPNTRRLRWAARLMRFAASVSRAVALGVRWPKSIRSFHRTES